MYSQESAEFAVIDVAESPDMVPALRHLLQSAGLGIDPDITHFVVAQQGGEWLGCAGLAGNTIKCVTVVAQHRGDNLSARLVGEVEQLAMQLGHLHLFLYTRPYNIACFKGCGFYPLAQWDDVAVLMENTPVGIQRYCRSLQPYYRPGSKIGGVVMNANPFTLGHLYLAEQAAAACDWLHLFVVREDVSLFPFTERLAMVRQGVAHLSNVTVHSGSEYLISHATFPAYFLKDSKLVNQTWGAIDLLIFRNYIAPALGITHRFVGSEPFCPLTHQYNQDMYTWLATADSASSPRIEVVEIPRKCHANGRAISASEVRALLTNPCLAALAQRVPGSTLMHLKMHMPAVSADKFLIQSGQ